MFSFHLGGDLCLALGRLFGRWSCRCRGFQLVECEHVPRREHSGRAGAELGRARGGDDYLNAVVAEKVIIRSQGCVLPLATLARPWDDGVRISVEVHGHHGASV